MKTTLLRLALVLAVALSLAASSVTEGPVLPWRVQVDLGFNSAGAVTSAVPQVFFRQTITINGSELVKDHGSVSWDSVAKKDLPVTITLADGTTATTTRGKVLLAVVAIAAEEKAAQPAP